MNAMSSCSLGMALASSTCARAARGGGLRRHKRGAEFSSRRPRLPSDDELSDLSPTHQRKGRTNAGAVAANDTTTVEQHNTAQTANRTACQACGT
jgi:hypothetical protein